MYSRTASRRACIAGWIGRCRTSSVTGSPGEKYVNQRHGAASNSSSICSGSLPSSWHTRTKSRGPPVVAASNAARSRVVGGIARSVTVPHPAEPTSDVPNGRPTAERDRSCIWPSPPANAISRLRGQWTTRSPRVLRASTGTTSPLMRTPGSRPSRPAPGNGSSSPALGFDDHLPDQGASAAEWVKVAPSIHAPREGDWSLWPCRAEDGTTYPEHYTDGRGRIAALLTTEGEVIGGAWACHRGLSLPKTPAAPQS